MFRTLILFICANPAAVIDAIVARNGIEFLSCLEAALHAELFFDLLQKVDIELLDFQDHCFHSSPMTNCVVYHIRTCKSLLCFFVRKTSEKGS